MYKYILYLYIFLIVAIWGCKSNASGDQKVQAAIQSDTISQLETTDSAILDSTENLLPDESGTMYRSSSYNLIIGPDGTIKISKNNKFIGATDYGGRQYDGPGYSPSVYTSKSVPDKPVIIIEAQADEGAEWYFAIILQNDKIIKTFFIDNPRTNGELNRIKDFLSIMVNKGDYIFRFNRKLIAKYSTIPDHFTRTDAYAYLTIPVHGNNDHETAKKTSASVVWLGHYSATLNKESKDWRDAYEISLFIKEDTVIYQAEGYQLYEKYLLIASYTDHIVTLKYLGAIDNTENPLVNQTDDFGTINFNYNKYIWNCPYINIRFNNGKARHLILTKN